MSPTQGQSAAETLPSVGDQSRAASSPLPRNVNSRLVDTVERVRASTKEQRAWFIGLLAIGISLLLLGTSGVLTAPPSGASAAAIEQVT